MDKDLGVNRGGSLGSWGRIGWHGPAPRHRPTPCPPGAVEVQVPEDPVVALVGTDATLCCSFSPEPGFSLAQLNLIWQLTDTKQLVHSFAEGRDQGSAYANRTALFPDLLAQGNASLRLQRVRVADEGSFTCFVSIRDFGSAAVSLQVAGEHPPRLHPPAALGPFPAVPPPTPGPRCPFPHVTPRPVQSLQLLHLCPLPHSSSLLEAQHDPGAQQGPAARGHGDHHVLQLPGLSGGRGALAGWAGAHP